MSFPEQHQQGTISFQKQQSWVSLNVPGPAVLDGFDAAWQQTASNASGLLEIQNLQRFFEVVQLQASPEQVQAALQHVVGTKATELSKDDAAVLCQLLSSHISAQSSLPGSSSLSEMKKNLSKRRLEYMESGHLSTDDAVLRYIQRLDEHRKRCELSGRYAEAAAAASRIQDLKTAQAGRLRHEVVDLQRSELCHLQEQYQQETQAFDQAWREKVAAYEAGVAAQLTTLKATHESQLAEFLLDCEVRRPQQPQHSAEYLNSRKIEEALVKQGRYRKAHELKVAADAMYHSELASTHMAWDSEVEMRRTRLLAKQQIELDVLLQRAARGRDELELRRLDEAEKRHNRFRCMVQELDSMQRLEIVHLENFLEGQVQAGKYVPLRGTSTFRRKREQLGLC